MHDKMVRLADVWKTCNKIRAAAFRVGLNLWDWYRPLDPEGNSLISESKFVSVLAGPLRSVVGLSDAEISQLADYFRAQDGRVLYHQLCQIIHGEDAGGRDKTSADCLLEACPPPPEPACHELDQWQLRRLCCLLATIADRQLPLKPYFQDYELVAKNDGRITFAHFARILNYVGVLVSAEDFNLLVRKFIKDSYTIDYVDFLRAVEAVKKEGIQGLGPAYRNPKSLIDTTLPKLSRDEQAAGAGALAAEVFHPALTPPRAPRGLIETMLRVQQFVLQNRVRVSEFFRDYDPLNSGRIAPQQFRRALDAMGAGAALSAREALCVTRHYLDPNDPERVCWRTFEDDCDQVFTVKELEKHPEVRAGAGAAEALLPPGARADLSPDELDLAQSALLRLRDKCRERAIDLRPAFADHDPHNSGHVSRSGVRRALARSGVLPAAAQLRALEERYLDDCGFSYVRLLDELEEPPPESATISATPPAPRRAPSAAADPLETDIVQILAKIKGKMVRDGVRPREFLRQFDRHNEQAIARADFYRGLGAAGLALSPREMDTLMEVFSAPGAGAGAGGARRVQYERFCSAVGSALVQDGLERAPLLTPVPHVPPAARDSPHNFLGYEERSLLSAALAKLAKHPDHVSNILEVFKDMDRSHCGTLPPATCSRALAQRGLLELLSTRERELLYKCFAYRRGCQDEVNYRGLCNALDLLFATSSGSPC